MVLRVIPEGLAAAGAAVEALTARLAAAQAAAAPLITVVVAPAGDEHATVAAQGVHELGRSGIGVSQSGMSYATGDAGAASSYLS
ncbi:PE family protein [Mycobacterium bohemicum DSM 44277]|uniref:Cell motility protein n=2 Tax=Mycobacterium bohemicum TaxID=56425 RepID=A0A1X1R6D1_MYCBE|nr:PE domain-containing protein [Mycobacterium bohemicum]MCV6969361.1 PE domain-containing protein [Mycobacterium bohemicum]ORV00319.1 cell motility protein [Mycobacterium bohemicum]CPR13216.1 PE family protein [Mycobacterium bohemicum DSM 44277]